MWFKVQKIFYVNNVPQAEDDLVTQDYRAAISKCRSYKAGTRFTVRVLAASDTRPIHVLYVNSDQGKTFVSRRPAPRGVLLSGFIKAFSVRTVKELEHWRDFIPEQVAPLPT
jgi:hypothetical protein